MPSTGHNFRDIRTLAERVRKAIVSEGVENGVIVAHSKGGLVGKYLMAHLDHDHRIQGMVSIATPYSGSHLARLIPHRAFRELVPTSNAVRMLKERREVNHRIISIMPEFDNHVWAEEKSYLDGALANIEVPVHGHNKVMYDKSVWEEVVKGIEKISNSKS